MWQVKLQSQPRPAPGQLPQFSGAFDATKQVRRTLQRAIYMHGDTQNGSASVFPSSSSARLLSVPLSSILSLVTPVQCQQKHL